MFHDSTDHQQKQIEVINSLENTSRENPNYSFVAPVDDFIHDSRLCLTSVHQLRSELSHQIVSDISEPLKKIDPLHFYYSPDNFHLTVKNIRTVSDPPHFDDQTKQTAFSLFSTTIPRHHVFQVYYYRLLILSTSLALVGTTDPELDNIILDLDSQMNQAGISDDKKYINNQYFFSNICLLRFTHPITPEFQQAVKEVSRSISFSPYLVDSVTLLVCNGVFQKRHILGTWNLNHG